MTEPLCEPRLIEAGDGGPGGWDCHTFDDGATFPSLCHEPNCPDRSRVVVEGE